MVEGLSSNVQLINACIKSMPPNNKQLYAQVKKDIYAKYPTHSAYRSGLLVQEYKRRGGTYNGKRDDGLKRWCATEWKANLVKQGTNSNLKFTDPL